MYESPLDAFITSCQEYKEQGEDVDLEEVRGEDMCDAIIQGDYE